VDAPTLRVDTLAETVAELARGQATLSDRVGELSGMVLELRFKDRAPAFFQRIARRLRVLGRTSSTTCSTRRWWTAA